MIGSRTGRLLACFAVLSLTLAGCSIEDSAAATAAALTLPATFSGSGVLTKPVSGSGYRPIDCSATGTATVQIDASGHLVLTVQVAAQPAMDLLGKCTTENGSVTQWATTNGVTDESPFWLEGECSMGLAATGTGSFKGSGPDAGIAINIHANCGNPKGGVAVYTLDAVVMK
jgi:hypothetical protein